MEYNKEYMVQSLYVLIKKIIRLEQLSVGMKSTLYYYLTVFIDSTPKTQWNNKIRSKPLWM